MCKAPIIIEGIKLAEAMLAFARNPRNWAVQKDEYAASSKADSPIVQGCRVVNK